jgi:hypothetical protein
MVLLPEKLMELEAEAWVAVEEGAAVVAMEEALEEPDEVEEAEPVEDATEEVAVTVLPERGNGPQ